MKDEATLYDVLEVREDASDKEIRANYIALVKRYHPDKAPALAQAPAQDATSPTAHAEDDVEEKIRALIDAYQVLSNTTARWKYDTSLLQRRKQEAIQSSASLKPRVAGKLHLESFDLYSKVDGRPLNEESSEVLIDAEEMGEIVYKHPCRCGNFYVIEATELETGAELVTCQGCSEVMRVEL